jgi:hypothetical protein
MAERAFARKIERMGFTDVAIGSRIPFGVDDAARYPLFTPAVIELMRSAIPPERQRAVAWSVIVTARVEGS